MRMLVVYFLFGTGTVLSMMNPVYAACFLTWNNIFRPLEFSYRAGAFSAANYVTLCLGVSVVVNLFRGKYRLQINLGTLFILLFLAWSGVSAAVAPISWIAWDGMILVLKYLVPLVFISMAFRSLRDVDFFTWIMALSVGIWSAQAGLHGIIRGKGITNMGIPGAQMSDRNDFIVGVLIAIPLLVYMIGYYHGPARKLVRPFLMCMTFLSLAAVPISLSRGGMVGLACMVLFVAMLSRKRVRNVALLVLIVPVVYYSLPDFVFERMSTIKVGEKQTENSARSRIGNMMAGVDMTLDNPITGVGPYAFMGHVGKYSQEHLEPHSIWIKASAELGIVGLLLYLAILVFLNWKLVGVYRSQFNHNRKTAHLAIAFVSSFIGFNAAATFSNKLYSEYQWTLIATAGAFIRLAEASPRRKPAGKAVVKAKRRVPKDWPVPPDGAERKDERSDAGTGERKDGRDDAGAGGHGGGAPDAAR